MDNLTFNEEVQKVFSRYINKGMTDRTGGLIYRDISRLIDEVYATNHYLYDQDAYEITAREDVLLRVVEEKQTIRVYIDRKTPQTKKH